VSLRCAAVRLCVGGLAAVPLFLFVSVLLRVLLLLFASFLVLLPPLSSAFFLRLVLAVRFSLAASRLVSVFRFLCSASASLPLGFRV
jgi:hypothetical protein